MSDNADIISSQLKTMSVCELIVLLCAENGCQSTWRNSFVSVSAAKPDKFFYCSKLRHEATSVKSFVFYLSLRGMTAVSTLAIVEQIKDRACLINSRKAFIEECI